MDLSELIKRLEASTVGGDPRNLRLIARLGQPFAPSPIPKGLPRFRKMKQCFRNAFNAACADQRLLYVEGVAALGCLCTEHAWNSLDGEHAIDLTWRDAPVVPVYFGVAIPIKEAAKLFGTNGSCYGPFLCDWAAEKGL
jgi:hypothetical protein